MFKFKLLLLVNVHFQPDKVQQFEDSKPLLKHQRLQYHTGI